MLRCKEITELASKKLDTQIPWYRRMELSVHLLVCKHCRRYAKQLAFLQEAFVDAEIKLQKPVLSDEAKQRIQKKLDELRFD